MKRLSICTCILALAAGCIPDDRGNFMVDDSFGLTAGEALVQASVHTGSYTLGVAKNGIGQVEASATVSLDDAAGTAALEAYNSEHGTSYKAVPASYFSLSTSSLQFAKDDVVKDVTLSWDAAALAEFIGTGTGFVLPVCINSASPETIKVNPAHQVILIRLIRTSVSVAQKSISRVIDRKKVEPSEDGTQPELEETVILDVKLDNFIKNVGLTFPVVIDNSLIAAYNAGKDEEYTAAPEGLVKILTPEASIPEGGESASFRIAIDKSILMQDGKLQAFPNYVIPVTLDTRAAKATLKGEAFNAAGLSWGNLVTYVTVTYLEIKPGLSVTREWGLYSTADASWSSVLDGFTAGADRNVTLDDQYIYIAETNQTGHLWAISRTDPMNARLLPVGTVASEGIFYLCCPRIIANTDPAINGGKDVLVVSNMTEGDPKLYVYADGIDSDPSVISLQTWASRRLGDTFTWWGSLQKGVLFFKDFNSAQGTVTFWMSGKTSGNMYLVGRIVAPPVTGAGAYFPFPDNVSRGVCSTRGGESAWLVSSSKDLSTLEGADTPSLTELSGYYADTAFRFFELGGKRYVAYTRQVSSSDGRLFVLEGEPGQAWDDILIQRNVVYQAAIQNDTEQGTLSEEPSPMSSGNSGMDLDVRLDGSDAYIAVLKQNVGLSLFRLSYND